MVSVSAGRGTEEPSSCFHCGTLVILDVPVGSAIGVDQYVYTVGESFKGIKHVPHGTHVVSYAAYDPIGNRFGPVTAMFVEIPKVERSGEDRCAGMDHDTAWSNINIAVGVGFAIVLVLIVFWGLLRR